MIFKRHPICKAVRARGPKSLNKPIQKTNMQLGRQEHPKVKREICDTKQYKQDFT